LNKTNVALFSNDAACAMTFSAHLPMNLAILGLSGTALKERNQTIGYKKHGGISAYHKAFLTF